MEMMITVDVLASVCVSQSANVAVHKISNHDHLPRTDRWKVLAVDRKAAASARAQLAGLARDHGCRRYAASRALLG